MGESDSEKILEAIKSLRSGMQEDMKQMRVSVEGKIDEVKIEVGKMETKLENQDTRIHQMEKETRKRNIIIYGIEEKEEENIKDTVQSFLRNTMEIEIKPEEIDDFYRMGKRTSNKNRPIMLKLLTNWKKQEIIRSTGKLRGTKIFIDQDLTAKEIEEKRRLLPIMLNYRRNGHYATMRGSLLYVNGKIYREGDQILPPTYRNTNNDSKESRGETSKKGSDKMEWTNSSSKGTPTLKRPMSPNCLRKANENLRKKPKHLTHQRTLSQGQLTLDKVGFRKDTSEIPATGQNEWKEGNSRNNSYESVIHNGNDSS